MVEFFTANINKNHMRKIYINAPRRFSEWRETHGLHQLADVPAQQIAIE